MTDRMDELIARYFPEGGARTEPVPFGLTNTTRIVTVHNRRYVARCYDRHTKSLPSLALEHGVTSYLASLSLSFEIPTFLPSLDGEPYVTLRDGTFGALIAYIEGSAPALASLGDAEMLGRIVGETAARLSQYATTLGDDYNGIPFTDFYRLHPLADRAAVAAFWDQPPYPVTERQRTAYLNAIAAVEARRHALTALPRQYVHHDLLVYNLLAVGDRVTGVLDFDFLSVDIAFLEFAISLNHVLQMSGGSLEMAAAYIRGYARFRTCSAEETLHLQTLTRLYHVAVLHIYIGQHGAGKDVGQAFSYIADQLALRDRWLEMHGSELAALIASGGSVPGA